ncbi:DUF308 domain-containing protein [Mycolicibacterium sp. ND9-15]|uniref:DUF308 domain-containing protein n=1 Tax=Mycolicibacterium sp. ND9-15 TaxID=3042320 RepID=UPI002DDB084E|nr:DUF308 domain-containing protein [Mycolicibacterium sp. ND9-15]WSE56050.1 DUF308 domain-containing protein [Mycolicibacterium sp. ND9-15]
MLIVALVLAVIGLAALVTAVVTSNELIAWICIAASLIGVILLIVDAVRERSARKAGAPQDGQAEAEPEYYEDYPEDEALTEEPEYAGDTDVEEETTVVEQADSGEDRR